VRRRAGAGARVSIIESTLRESGHQGAVIKVFPGADHTIRLVRSDGRRTYAWVSRDDGGVAAVCRPLSDAGALHDAAMTPASSKETANTVEWAPTDAALPREPSPPHEKQGPDQGQHREFERCVEERV